MWEIKIISFDNYDTIFNFLDNNLLEFIVINRTNFLAIPDTLNGIRATQISFAGGNDNINLNDFENENTISLCLNLITNELKVFSLNNLDNDIYSDYLSSNYDFDESYISDEDFNFSRYEITNSDFNFDDTDWNYNSS